LNHKFIRNSGEIDIKQCIFEINEDNCDVLSEEELEKIEINDIEFLKNPKIDRFIGEIISDFTKKTLNFEILTKKLNLLKFLMDKELILRENLYEKLILIYNMKKNLKISQISLKRPLILSAKELKEINEISQKGRISDKKIEISLFNDKKAEKLEEIMKKSIESPVFPTIYQEKVFDYKVLPKDLDYNSLEISQFITNYDKKHDISEEITEKENDFFFDFSPKKQDIFLKNNENLLTKQFINLNKSPLNELEIINKSPYDPGVKSSVLYLKNLHSKVVVLSVFSIK